MNAAENDHLSLRCSRRAQPVRNSRLAFGLAVVIVVVTSIALNAEVVGFEDSPAEVGSDVAALPGWRSTVPALSVVTDTESGEGRRSLRLSVVEAGEHSVAWTFNTPSAQVFFLEFLIRPPADPAPEPEYSVEAGGARLAFVREGSFGTVLSLAAGDRAARATGHEFQVNEAGQATEWQRVTLRVDQKGGKFDLSINGRLVLVEQRSWPAAPGSSPELRIFASSFGAVFVDGISVSVANPLFADRDSDGLPDAYEVAQGMNLAADDRAQTTLSDGLINIARFHADVSTASRANHSHLSASRSASSSHIWYVDQQNGDDGFSGRFPYPLTGAAGPLRSFKAAADLAAERDIIVILPSPDPYLMDLSAAIPKSLTLRPVGNIKIR